jgi:predicted nucleotidyltransferase
LPLVKKTLILRKLSELEVYLEHLREFSSVKEFLASEKTIKFAYLFGSMARNDDGTLSDLDLAVYLDGRVDSFSCRLKIMETLAKKIGSEKFDLIVLNNASVLLRHEVVKEGIVLKEDRPRRVMFETQVLREYLDTAYLRQVHREYLKESLQQNNGLYG